MLLDSSTAEPLDPALLVAFRQQAGAVLAQERGLTPAGRVKLAGIARQLGIGEGQIEAAIRSLGESAAPPAPANPIVLKFRSRLRKDLASTSRTILGPRIEAQIVAAAHRKYGLDEPTAREVLAEVAAELGLRRISADQAIDSLAGQIDQAAGDATWLAKEAWDRLRIAGAKWGIELELVDQLIDEKLVANRTDRDRRRLMVRTTLLGTGGVVAAVAIVLAFVAMYRAAPDFEPASPDPGIPTAATPDRGPAVATQPPWWDVDLSIAVANARKFPQVEPLYAALTSAEARERAGAYRKLAELALAPAPQPGLDSALASVLAGVYALEPDEAAASEVLASLLALVPAIDASLPKNRTQYLAAYFAGDAVARIHRRPGLNEDRRRQLESAAQSSLRLALDPAATQLQSERAARIAVTRRLFAQLTAAAPRQPAEAAALFGYLTDLAVDLSDEEFARLEATYVASALPAAGKNWRQYEDAIIRAIASPDPLHALKMLDAYQRITDPQLKQQLAEWLINRGRVPPKSWAPIDVVTAVRKGLGVSGTAATTADDRWQLLRLRADAALAQPTPSADRHQQLLAQTIELAHLTTLAMALAQGDAGFAVFDANIDLAPQLSGGEMPTEDPAADRTPRRLPPPVGSREDRALDRWVTLVGNHARQQQVQRESNFRGLAKLAERHPDLTPQEAAKAAEYVLAAKADDELRVVVETLGSMGRWKRLRLAIADGLARSAIGPDQRRQVAAAIADVSGLPADAGGDALRLAVLQSVLQELNDSGEPAAANDAASRLLDQAGELLAESYRTRARLLSVSPSAVLAADSPAKLLALSIDPLAATLRPLADEDDSRLLARLPHEASAWGYYCRSDLARTAATGRTLVELASRRVARLRPTQAATAQQVATELSAAEMSATSVLVQLREQEAAHLKLWMLYAH